MNDRLLEQRIKTKFCVKLRQEASDICAMFSEACEGEALCFEWHKWFKESRETLKMMKEVVVQDLTEQMKMLNKCGIWCIQ
jgi:hypothetical protein